MVFVLIFLGNKNLSCEKKFKHLIKDLILCFHTQKDQNHSSGLFLNRQKRERTLYNWTGSAPLITDRPPTSFTTLSKKKVTLDTWHLTHDMQHMIPDM